LRRKGIEILFFLFSLNSISTAENGPSRKRLKKSDQSNLDQESLFLHYITTFDSSISPLKKIRRLCSQLKLSNLSEEFCLQITKNLIYLSKLPSSSNSTQMDLVVRHCCRLATFESIKYPNEITRCSIISKWMAGLVLDLSSLLTAHLKTFLIAIEREIEHDETTINLPLKTLVQDIFDVFKRHCNTHVITSILADIVKQRRTKR